jgi:hypothetical protein
MPSPSAAISTGLPPAVACQPGEYVTCAETTWPAATEASMTALWREVQRQPAGG